MSMFFFLNTKPNLKEKQKQKMLSWLQDNVKPLFWTITRYFFKSDARLKLAKSKPNVKQRPETELLLFEHYLHSSSTLSSKNDRTYSPK